MIYLAGVRGHKHRWTTTRNSDCYGLETFEMCRCGRMRLDPNGPKKPPHETIHPTYTPDCPIWAAEKMQEALG